eukprot:CAMPEP_0119083416 /NCGR_PEP_ID=MMETSP1178-20130426/125477_1 /TAXON_ID=33656 /ORGANISM="unid sp, Strain CCMP2000" /LENGTH=147 /DNA_ID=CAMNT_0007066275 /DNA_START=714 /DNA_END=1157 /DNA_ORIENTATION=-
MLTNLFSISAERSHSQSSWPRSARPDWLKNVLHFQAFAHRSNATNRVGTPSPLPPPSSSRSEDRLLVSAAFMACPIGCRKLGTDQTLSSWQRLNWPGNGRCGHSPVSKNETSDRYWYRVLLSPRKTMLRPRKAPSATVALMSAPLRE